MLSEGQIKKFQELYKAQFGIEINTEEAIEKGERLIRVIKVVSTHTFNESNDRKIN